MDEQSDRVVANWDEVSLDIDVRSNYQMNLINNLAGVNILQFWSQCNLWGEQSNGLAYIKVKLLISAISQHPRSSDDVQDGGQKGRGINTISNR